MGWLRLFLAYLVALSHAGFGIAGYNPGVIAVVSFFLLSGYVMTVLLDRHYRTADRAFAFYLDRAARLFPQFGFYCLATLVLMSVLPIANPFLANCTAAKVALNAAILPLDFFQFTSIESCMLIPQAWSLGLEMSFYLVAPIIVVAPAALRWMVLGSIVVFAAAYGGAINTDAFGYRLLPGTLFIFAVGAAFAKPVLWRWFPAAVWAGSAILLCGLYLHRPFLELPHSKEVLAGLVIGIPVLYVLKDRPFGALDEVLGNLSYGVFLNHFFCIYVLQAAGIEIVRLRHVALLIAVSTVLSAVSYLVIERPALQWRRRIRYGRFDRHETDRARTEMGCA